MSDFARSNPPGPATLRQLLSRDQLLTVPGCYDGLGARLIEQAGFSAAYLTGFGSSASLLGRPDIGLLSATEMVDSARRLVMATSLPIIADADTGYGNPLNVIRTVRDYERAGVGALQLEDQVTPKRCGHMDDKAVIPSQDMVAKIRAAVSARTDPDLVIIARTDARAVEGFDAALSRAGSYVEAGADVLFIEALRHPDEFAAAASRGFGVPLVYNWVEGGKTPLLSADEISKLGYRILLLPISVLLRATEAMRAVLDEIHTEGTPRIPASGGESDHDPFAAFNQFVGLPEILDLQRQFTS
ncbi:MAG: carboxyvinyl-carboxyphosphonate phosphorylmutase [Actinomycetia bacterium]|nr:carboxyvinyl-carboxyphosphonate phosphorylmutase [Actinomycetes bacterium]